MKLKSRMVYFLVFALGGYALIALLMYQFQEKFIFYPMPLAPDYPFSQFRDFEEVYLEVENGVRLHALYFKAAAPKGTILYFHGNARAVNDWGYAAQDLVELGFEVLMPDYRSYGKSGGKLSEKAMKEDAQHWYDYLREEINESDLILFGRSLGTGVATFVAAQNHPRQLILETPYTSMVEMAKTVIRFLPVSLLSRYHFRTDQIIEKVPCQIDIIHGTQDELIPYEQALRLSKGKATLHTIEGGGHNNLAQFPEYHQVLKQILTTADF